MKTYPFADLDLARRLESCEGRTNAAFVEARARVAPDVGAAWLACAGARAMFDGVGSPLTQTFGLGVFETPSDESMETIETFLRERGAAVHHEVSPMVDPETMQRLVARGYHPIELTSVLFQPLEAAAPRADRLRTRIVDASEIDLWADTAAAGWSETPELGAFMRELAAVTARSDGTFSFVAELDGAPIATGALAMHDGVALLAGASTIPAARNQGAQRALLEARLHFAATHGCDLAMMCAAPGSTSQRNAERRGFRIAYTRIKWALGA